MTLPLLCCAEQTGSQHWNRLPLEVQERIVVLLPLQDLGKAVCLGKAFRWAFMQRLSQAEERLNSRGLAAFGKPLIAGLGRVLQRYSRNVDLLTGCGALPLGQQVTVTSTGGSYFGPPKADFWHGCREPFPHAIVGLPPRYEGASSEGEQDLIVYLRARDGVKVAHFSLHGPPSGIYRGINSWLEDQTSWTAEGFSPAVPNAAGMTKAAGTLDISLPDSPTAQQAGEFMGGFLLAARVAAEGPMCLENLSSCLEAHAADPVTRAASVAPEGPMAHGPMWPWVPWAPEELVGPWAMGVGNPNAPPEAHAADPETITATGAGEEPMRPENPTPVPAQPAHATDPVTLAFPCGGRPVESVQESQGILADAAAFQELYMNPSGPFSAAFRHPPVQIAGGGIRRATLEAHPGTDDNLPMDETDQAITAALKLAVGLQIPCCKIVIPMVVRVSFALRK
jgi:hypothetical protein